MNTRNSKRGGVLSGLLLTAAGIVVLMIVAGLFVARNVRVITSHRAGGRDDVLIDLPGGHVSMRARGGMNPAGLGIPVYPNAVQKRDGGAASLEWSSDDGREDKAVAVAGADLITADPPEKVLAYYRGQLPSWVIVTDRDGSTRLELNKNGYRRMVVIKEKIDGTHIGVATFGEPASN